MRQITGKIRPIDDSLELGYPIFRQTQMDNGAVPLEIRGFKPWQMPVTFRGIISSARCIRLGPPFGSWVLSAGETGEALSR